MAEKQKRIEINEDVQIRELPGQATQFGLFSLKEKKFLAQEGKNIVLQADDALVLPASHTLTKTLDLTFKNKDGNDLPGHNKIVRDEEGEIDLEKSTPRIIVENRGKNIELKGTNLAVTGSATFVVDKKKLESGERVDVYSSKAGKSWAVHFDNTLIGAVGMGRVDCADDKGTKLLTLDGTEESGVNRKRINDMKAHREGAVKDEDSEREHNERIKTLPSQAPSRPDGRAQAAAQNEQAKDIAGVTEEGRVQAIEHGRFNGMVSNFSLITAIELADHNNIVVPQIPNQRQNNIGQQTKGGFSVA